MPEPDKQIMDRYLSMMDLLKKARCRRLKKSEIDERIVGLSQTSAWHDWKSLCRKYPDYYWAGDPPSEDIRIYHEIRKVLVDLWKATYDVEKEEDENTESKVSEQDPCVIEN